MTDPSAITIKHPLLTNPYDPVPVYPVLRDNPEWAELKSCRVIYLYAASEILVMLHPKAWPQPATFRLDANSPTGEAGPMFTLFNSAMRNADRVDVAYRPRVDGEPQTLLAVALAVD